MQASIEHPTGSKIVLRQIENFMTVHGERKAFGSSWQVTIPAERTHGKGRVRKQCATLENAKAWAEEQDKALGRGSGYLELSESDRGQAMAAFQLAKDAKLPLIDLVKDAIAAVKLVGSPERLVDAGRYWKERKGNIKPKTVTDAITELLKAKEQDGVSAVHHKDLRLRLENGFSEKFGLANVGDLDAQQIDAWLRGLDVGKRSRVNYRRVVLTFLRFCERRGWLARGAIDGTMIDSPKVKSTGAIEIFKPEELRLLLERES